NPEALRSLRRADLDLLAFKKGFPGVRGLDAVDCLDQRALSRAVVADQGDYLPRIHLEVHLVHGPHGPEALAESPQREEMLGRPAAVTGFLRLCFSSRHQGIPIEPALAQSCGLAGRRELGGTDLIRCPVAVRGDELLAAVLGGRDARRSGAAILSHRNRGEEERRDVNLTVVGLRLRNGKTSGRNRLALSEGYGDLRRGLRLGPGRLVDRHVLVAGEDPLN